MNGTKLFCVVVLAVGSIIVDRTNAIAQFAGPGAQPKSNSDVEKQSHEHSLIKSIASQSSPEPTVTADFCKCIGENPVAVARIEQALRAPLRSAGLEFQATPLVDALTQIQADYGLPIQVDKPALEEAAIGTDTQVDANIHNTSLRAALRLMLNTIQLTYVIHDGYLLVTTREVADNSLKTCVYDVRSIVGNNEPLEPLINVIVSCVAKDTWAKNGKGDAEIRPIKPGLLVITQSQAVQDEIRALLTTLDEMRNRHPAASASPAPRTSTVAPDRRGDEKPDSGPGQAGSTFAPGPGTNDSAPGIFAPDARPKPDAADNPFG
jgi:hypothetical protein